LTPRLRSKLGSAGAISVDLKPGGSPVDRKHHAHQDVDPPGSAPKVDLSPLRNQTVDLLLTMGFRSASWPGISLEGQIRGSSSAQLGQAEGGSSRMQSPRFLPAGHGRGAHARPRFRPVRPVLDTRCRAGTACRSSPGRAHYRGHPSAGDDSPASPESGIDRAIGLEVAVEERGTPWNWPPGTAQDPAVRPRPRYFGFCRGQAPASTRCSRLTTWIRRAPSCSAAARSYSPGRSRTAPGRDSPSGHPMGTSTAWALAPRKCQASRPKTPDRACSTRGVSGSPGGRR
jgi:hypothetical protein